ncbi:MAG: hypothetical protein ACRDAI_04135 [Candidatus Rhabdochlamydia sp.]
MAIIANPLSCNKYFNQGDYFQKICSEQSNLVLRTTLVFAKMISRLFDASVHTCLGVIKAIVSAAMAASSIPFAAFGCTPTHHKVAKEASRHLGLALFFVADIFISPANITNSYPQFLLDKIQKYLEIEDICEEVANNFEVTYQNSKETIVNINSQRIHTLEKKNDELNKENKSLKKIINQLTEEKNETTKKYLDLLNQELEKINNEITAA